MQFDLDQLLRKGHQQLMFKIISKLTFKICLSNMKRKKKLHLITAYTIQFIHKVHTCLSIMNIQTLYVFIPSVQSDINMAADCSCCLIPLLYICIHVIEIKLLLQPDLLLRANNRSLVVIYWRLNSFFKALIQ